MDNLNNVKEKKQLEYHVHYVAQKHKKTYNEIYRRYGRFIDPKTRMIKAEHLKNII